MVENQLSFNVPSMSVVDQLTIVATRKMLELDVEVCDSTGYSCGDAFLSCAHVQLPVKTTVLEF